MVTRQEAYDAMQIVFNAPFPLLDSVKSQIVYEIDKQQSWTMAHQYYSIGCPYGDTPEGCHKWIVQRLQKKSLPVRFKKFMWDRFEIIK